jgi:hypothetical protein
MQIPQKSEVSALLMAVSEPEPEAKPEGDKERLVPLPCIS